jgi:hypothetical protein
MTITYDGVLLASATLADARLGPTGLRVNGRQVVEEIDLARAAAITAVARGNRRNEVTFTVAASFSSRKLAGAFRSKHLNDLATSGDLVFTDGDSGDTGDTTLADAVLKSLDCQQHGVLVLATYTFVGGVFS